MYHFERIVIYFHIFESGKHLLCWILFVNNNKRRFNTQSLSFFIYFLSFGVSAVKAFHLRFSTKLAPCELKNKSSNIGFRIDVNCPINEPNWIHVKRHREITGKMILCQTIIHRDKNEFHLIIVVCWVARLAILNTTLWNYIITESHRKNTICLL